jgi:phosphatidylserine/phosphatidylglycerophosphate/cardiolipin synthase-like enzyme
LSASLGFVHEQIEKGTEVYTLDNGGQSLVARLWLFEHANKTIDIQYYSLTKDASGRLACHYLVQAADRGVKIRILLDDAASRTKNRDLKVLDSHDNIEIRFYNAGLKAGRMDKKLSKLEKNILRLLRRMHNKTFVADGEVCLAGGRNIADEYFDYDHKYNFRDRDAMLIGKAVSEAQQAFDTFWNNPLTATYSELSGKKNKKKLTDPARFNCMHNFPSKMQDLRTQVVKKVEHFPEEFKALRESGEIIFTNDVTFISDKPGKNEDRGREGGICTDSMISLIRQAKKTIDIQSPYFIVTREAKQLIEETLNRGVKIRLLTNSLASIDIVGAFSAFQKNRKKLIKMGVQIYEFKPDSRERYHLMANEVQKPINYKSTYGFHAKSLIIDGHITVIGSYNFDPRSANYNTECMCVIRSEKVASRLSKQFDEEFLPDNSWPDTDRCNPDYKASVKKRIQAFIRLLVPKKLL